MNISKFEEMICLYGCDDNKWPEEYRNEMNIFVQSSEEARVMLKEYDLLDIELAKIDTNSISRDKVNSAIAEITGNNNIVANDNNNAFYKIAAVILVVVIAVGVVIKISDPGKVKGIQSANNDKVINNEINIDNVNNEKTITNLANQERKNNSNIQVSNISDDSINSLFDDMQDESFEASELLALLD